MKKKKEADETFTEQFSNNIPNELECVNSAIKYMKCEPTFHFSLKVKCVLAIVGMYDKSNR